MFCKQTIEREGVFLSSVSSLLCVCVCGASLQQRMQGKTGSRFRALSLSLSLSLLSMLSSSFALSLLVCTNHNYVSVSLSLFRHAIFIRLIIHSIIMYKDYILLILLRLRHAFVVVVVDISRQNTQR